MRRPITRLVAAVRCSLLLLSLLTSCMPSARNKKKVYYSYFDTVTEISCYRTESEKDFSANADAAAALLEKYHRLLDIYYEYDGTVNLATLNRLAGGDPLPAERELIDFLLFAKEVYVLTDGYVNIAMGAVLSLWHDFREDPTSVPLPSEEALTAAAAHTAIDALVIDAEAGTVYLSDPDASLDVGALGKGYAAAQARELLRARGADSYVINAGGNLVILGAHEDGTPFTTGVRDPRGDGYALTLSLADTAFVTSGDYERYVTVDGVRYSHIIDKDTLSPARRFASVSVMGEDSGLCDALSTALFVLPYERGRALVLRLGYDAVWITEAGEVLTTDGIPT